MHESTVKANGQTTLPQEDRTALGVKDGDRVRYVIHDGEVRLLKVRSVRELRGVLARPDQKPVSLEEIDDAIANGISERMLKKT